LESSSVKKNCRVQRCEVLRAATGSAQMIKLENSLLPAGCSCSYMEKGEQSRTGGYLLLSAHTQQPDKYELSFLLVCSGSDNNGIHRHVWMMVGRLREAFKSILAA